MIFLQPEPKNVKKIFSTLQTQLAYLSSRSNAAQGEKTTDEFAGEYQTLMDQEFFDFVIYEVPWIIT
jgi:V-type H+-transporting ATPase subunit C